MKLSDPERPSIVLLPFENISDDPDQDFLTDGLIAGVGSVVVFLPQIVLLFSLLYFLEDVGYMARAAFVVDRAMARIGLEGRAFVALLSSFACAVPGIMATRTVPSPRDRLVTILVAPLMTCSAGRNRLRVRSGMPRGYA